MIARRYIAAGLAFAAVSLGASGALGSIEREPPGPTFALVVQLWDGSEWAVLTDASREECNRAAIGWGQAEGVPVVWCEQEPDA